MLLLIYIIFAGVVLSGCLLKKLQVLEAFEKMDEYLLLRVPATPT